jgi:photosystem II stability/assembly factor-like uncharacterized protein
VRAGRRSPLELVALATVGVVVAVSATAGGSLVGAQEDGGTVSAEVTMQPPREVCLLLSTNSLNFGVLDFADGATSDAYTITSCSVGDQDLFAYGTGATGDGDPAASWALIDAASLGVNEFSVDAVVTGVGSAPLTVASTAVGVLDAGQSAAAEHTLIMPPQGSSGAGQTLNFDLVWTASVRDEEPTWTAQESGTTVLLRDVHFVDTQRGWAVGDSGTILATTDSGDTWVPQQSGVTARLNGVAFADDQTGIAVGLSGTVLRTTNGGTTWTPVAFPFTEYIDVHFVDELYGWLTGLNGVWATTNGGVSWVQQFSTRFMSAVTFIDRDRGWAVGGGTIIRTTNGGATWQVAEAPDVPIISLFDVSFVDANRGWASNNGGQLITTTDGGATWTLQGESPGFVGGVATQFIDAARGWSVRANSIVVTIDGGDTWTTQLDLGTGNFSGLYMLSATRGWAVGLNGDIYVYR